MHAIPRSVQALSDHVIQFRFDVVGHGVELVARMQRIEQMEERLFVHRLYRAGDVAVLLLERLVGLARGPEQIFQLG